ncbi:MAG: motility protein A [Spirochaetes bacterium]|nr:motility protein A [Spirochaetota bacterium]
MDLATIIGVAGGFAMVLFGIISARGDIRLFIDVPSIFITFGGGLLACLVGTPLKDFINIVKLVKLVAFVQPFDPASTIRMLITFSEKARREGVLALEDDIQELDDQFLKKAIQLVVDGTEPEKIKNILYTEMEYINQRHQVGINIFSELDSLFPAFGMIGTLIGLIIMLANMNNKAALTQGLATALITTLYGSILANIIAHPFSTKLKERNDKEMLIKEIMIEGTLSIQSGENPRLLKDKLISFLPNELREQLQKELGD